MLVYEPISPRASISNDAFLAELRRLLASESVTVANIIASLVQAQDREMPRGSLKKFCMRELGMTKDRAAVRATAAKTVRRHPKLLDAIASGALTLSNLIELKKIITPENLDECVALATGKTKREVRALVAARSARKQTRSVVRVLPNVTPIAAREEGADASVATEPAMSLDPGSTRITDRSWGAAPPLVPLAAEAAPLPSLPEDGAPDSGRLFRSHETLDEEAMQLMRAARRLHRQAHPTATDLECTKSAYRLYIAELSKLHAVDVAAAGDTAPPASRSPSVVPEGDSRGVSAVPIDVRCAHVDDAGQRCPVVVAGVFARQGATTDRTHDFCPDHAKANGERRAAVRDESTRPPAPAIQSARGSARREPATAAPAGVGATVRTRASTRSRAEDDGDFAHRLRSALGKLGLRRAGGSARPPNGAKHG